MHYNGSVTTAGSSFQTISLFDIAPESSLPFDLYVYFKGTFLPYRTIGQSLSQERFNRFVLKRIGKLFVRGEEYQKFCDYRKQTQKAEADELDRFGISAEQKACVQMATGMRSVTQEVFLAEKPEELSQKVEAVLEVAKATVEKVLQMPYVRAFEAIPQTQTDIINHSIRVGLLSTYLGYQLGFVNPIGLEYLAAAAVLHDIGKTKIAELESTLDEESEEEKAILRNHPILSVEMLDQAGFVPDEIKRIILEHHEEREGGGYPNGIRGPKMLGLSKVFSIANAFDNLMCDETGDRKTRSAHVVKKMESMTDRFDLVLLPKALKLLKS